MPQIVRAHVIVTGKVQGVWFRQATLEESTRLGLGGWVRNLASGQVEALFEGEPEAVEAMIAWCRRGPPLARVDDVDITRSPGSGGIIKPFAVRPTP